MSNLKPENVHDARCSTNNIFLCLPLWYMQDNVRCSPKCTTCCVQLLNNDIPLASDDTQQSVAPLTIKAHLQDSIGSVSTDDGDDLQLFSDLCP